MASSDAGADRARAWYSRNMRWLLALVFVMLAAPALGLAEEGDPDSGWVRIRANAGLSPEVVGVSLAVRAADPFEVEAGFGLTAWFARLGYAIRLNPNSRGNTHLELVPAIGFAKFWEIEFLTLSTVPRDIPHGQIGLGVVSWVGPSIGLEGRVNVGVAFAQDYKRADGTIDSGGVLPIVSLTGGVAF